MSHRQESTEQAVPQRVNTTIQQWADRFSASPDSILLCDGRGRILYVNDQQRRTSEMRSSIVTHLFMVEPLQPLSGWLVLLTDTSPVSTMSTQSSRS